MVTPALAQEISELEADFCSALSDPTRLLILYALAEAPHNVTELAHELDVIQPTASRHLKILRERGPGLYRAPGHHYYLPSRRPQAYSGTRPA